MSVRTYNPSVRVGNWNEDVQLQEDTLKDFLEKKEKGELLLQRTQNVVAGATQAVSVSTSRDGFVHYGDSVMLVNQPSTPDRGECSLSLNMTAESLSSADPTAIPPGLSGCAGAKPSTRNLLVVMSPCGSTGEPLRYNEPFYLCMPTGEGNLYLKSEVASFQNASKKARHNNLTLVAEPSFGTQFEVSYFDPRLRIEFEHHPVPANERVIVNHQKTNQAIAVESAHQLRTVFGWEFEVSCHTYLDSHKAEEDSNHWKFVMNVPGTPASR